MKLINFVALFKFLLLKYFHFNSCNFDRVSVFVILLINLHKSLKNYINVDSLFFFFFPFNNTIIITDIVELAKVGNGTNILKFTQTTASRLIR
jgi:hypothetical protein